MKRIFSFILLLATTATVFAQQKQKKIPVIPTPVVDTSFIGIIAGPNFNHLAYTDKTTTIKGNNISFHGGMFYQEKLSKVFILQPQLLLSVHGGKIDNIDSTINTSLYTIELPINFFYKEKKLFIGIGPVACYGIMSKQKSNGNKRDVYAVAEAKERTLKRFEWGGNLLAQYQLRKKILLTINYFQGLSNIYKGDGSAPSDLKAHTNYCGISIAYLLGIYREKE